MAAYRAGLVQSLGELRDEDRRHFGEIGDIAPRECLSRTTSLVSLRRREDLTPIAMV